LRLRRELYGLAVSMSVDLDFSKSFFELFGLPEAFEIDAERLAERYRALQAALHPDRFASASEHERRLSVQGASWINEAHETLKVPLSRARYLLTLKGVDFDADKDTASDPEFLMQQIELREQLEEVDSKADPFAALDEISRAIRDWNLELQAQFASAYDADEFDLARQTVLKMQFFDRLFDELRRKEEHLEETLM
jgi:molecular chaperone HscB